MNKYAAYDVSDWLFDIHADSLDEALKSAHERDPNVTRVEEISEVFRD